MKRRDFITLLAGATAALPFAADAQQPKRLPIIGFLGATTPTVWSPFVNAFLHRMRELGWVDGRNIAIEYRWAQGSQQRYAEFASEFVRLNVDVIVTSGTAPVLSAKKATSEIPIVFAAAGDPVGTQIVDSLAGRAVM
jgi:putative ABC transport system substrate-binding protein